MAKEKRETVDGLSIKYINHNEEQQAELHKIIMKGVQFMRKKFAPALDLLTDEFAAKAANQFLLEIKAEFLLDEAAIERGFKDAADEQYQLTQQKKEKEAMEAAAFQSKEKAKRDEEDQIALGEAERAKKLQALRDEEDARRAAELKAALKAVNIGNERAGV